MSKVSLMPDIELLTSAQVAERFGVDVRTVARWVNSGRIRPPAVQGPGLRGARLFRPEDVEADLAERKAAS